MASAWGPGACALRTCAALGLLPEPCLWSSYPGEYSACPGWGLQAHRLRRPACLPPFPEPCRRTTPLAVPNRNRTERAPTGRDRARDKGRAGTAQDLRMNWHSWWRTWRCLALNGLPVLHRAERSARSPLSRFEVRAGVFPTWRRSASLACDRATFSKHAPSLALQHRAVGRSSFSPAPAAPRMTFRAPNARVSASTRGSTHA